MTNSQLTIIVYLVFFSFMLIFSFLMNRIFLKLAKTLGIRNMEDTVIRWGKDVKPALGGINFYIVFLLSIASYSIFFDHEKLFLNVEFMGVLAAGSLGFIMGLSDDAYNTKPILKGFTQLCCALVLIITGTYINITPYLWLNYSLTIIWVVGIMNSINMLDNMDSITTTVSISIILSAFSIIILQGDFNNIYLIIIVGLLASLLAFLYFNWYPSKMYMGDTGSQFLGAMLAAFGIIYFWNGTDANGLEIPSKQILTTLLIFIIPLTDTFTVIINRLRKGNSPFVGGKDHTTHHLVYLGLSDRKVAILYSTLSLTSLILILLILRFLPLWNYLHIILFSLYILFLFGILYYTTRINQPSQD